VVVLLDQEGIHLITWIWIAAGLVAGGVLLLAMKLWGAQIIAGVVAIAASEAWKAFTAHAKGLETPEQLQKRAREGRERNDR
jgi:hypothetical protein